MLFVRRIANRLNLMIATFVLLAVASCEPNLPTEPAATLDRTAEGLSSGAASPLTRADAGHVVNGHGAVWVESGSQYMNISFQARRNAAGEVTGTWHHQFRSRTPAGRVKVSVTCLSVSGNEAWLAGYAVQAGSEANLGKWFGLHVIDRGEGHGVVDEMSRTLWFGFDPDHASAFCATMPIDHDLWPLAEGNVQVR